MAAHRQANECCMTWIILESDALNLVTALTRPTFGHFPFGCIGDISLQSAVDETAQKPGSSIVSANAIQLLTPYQNTAVA